MTKKLLFFLLLATTACATQIERVIQKTDPKVVKIGIVGEKGAGTCSGAVIAEDGLTLTCAHCFDHPNIKKVFIKSAKGEVYTASLVKIDFKKDLALIVPNEIADFPYFQYGIEPKKGQQVLSFGSPLGLQGNDSVGWVTDFINGNSIAGKGRYIIHSAFINPGNSGGPLVDLKGRLIGINEATVGYGFFQEAQGFFVAIDIQTIKEFVGLDKLK